MLCEVTVRRPAGILLRVLLHLDRTVFDHPSLTFALAMAIGVFAQGIARHMYLPGVVVLLAVGRAARARRRGRDPAARCWARRCRRSSASRSR
jgi:hypothetical protein